MFLWKMRFFACPKAQSLVFWSLSALKMKACKPIPQRFFCCEALEVKRVVLLKVGVNWRRLFLPTFTNFLLLIRICFNSRFLACDESVNCRNDV